MYLIILHNCLWKSTHKNWTFYSPTILKLFFPVVHNIWFLFFFLSCQSLSFGHAVLYRVPNNRPGLSPCFSVTKSSFCVSDDTPSLLLQV